MKKFLSCFIALTIVLSAFTGTIAFASPYNDLEIRELDLDLDDDLYDGAIIEAELPEVLEDSESDQPYEIITDVPNATSDAEQALQAELTDRVVESAPNAASGADQALQAELADRVVESAPNAASGAGPALQAELADRVVESAPNTASGADQALQAELADGVMVVVPNAASSADQALQTELADQVVESAPNAASGADQALQEEQDNQVVEIVPNAANDDDQALQEEQADGVMVVVPNAANGADRALQAELADQVMESVPNTASGAAQALQEEAQQYTILESVPNTTVLGTLDRLDEGEDNIAMAAAAGTFRMTPSTDWSVGASGGSRSLTASGTGWTTCEVFGPSWITGKDNGGGKITLTASANTSSARSGTISFETDTGLTQSFKVTQAAAPASLTVSPSTAWSVAASGGSRELTVSGTGWATYTVSGPSWLTAVNNGAGKSTLTAGENTSTARSGTVTVQTSTGLKQSFTVTQAAAPPSLTVSPSTAWSIGTYGGTRELTVSGTGWTTCTVSGPSWITAKDNGGGKITLTASTNTSSARSGTVTLQTNTGLQKSFGVSQMAAPPSLTISPSTDWSIGTSGGSRELTISGTGWASYSISGPSWLTGKDNGAGKSTLTASANTSYERSGTVTVKTNTGLQKSFKVTQSAAPPSLTVSPSTAWSVGNSGGSRVLTVTGTGWTSYTVSGPSWLTTMNNGGGKTTITAGTNTSIARSGTVTVKTNTGLQKSFTVTQAEAAPHLTVSPSTAWSVGNSGGSRVLTVTGTGWTSCEVFGPSWITAKDNGGGKITLTASANTSTDRSGTITLKTNTGLQKSFTVTQSGKPASLTIYPTISWNIEASGGSRVVEVSGVGWTTYSISGPAWITAVNNGAGKTTLTASANNSSLRSATVTVQTDTGLKKTFTATQYAVVPSLTVSPSTSWSVGFSGGSRVLEISGAGWDTYTVSGPAWITATHNGAGKTTITAGANNSLARSGTVTVKTNTGLQKSFGVSQSASTTPAPTLTVSPSKTWSIKAAGGASIHTVSGIGWDTYTVSGPEWVTAKHNGTGKTTLTVGANGLTARSGTVTFKTNTGLQQSFTVTQAAATTLPPTLTVSPSTAWSIAASGGSRELMVSGTGWTTCTISGPEWLTATDNGGGNITLTAGANTSVKRSGTVVVKTNTDLQKSFTVTQAAAATPIGTVTITYNGNGHTGGTVPSDQTVITPGNFQFEAATMTKTNHTFVGWRSSNGVTLYEVGKTYAYTAATNGTLSVKAEWKAATGYESLNFAYPLPTQYNGISTYSGHLGLDIHAPKNTTIYSVESGTVLYAGLDTGGTAGYFVSIEHNVNDPTKSGSNKMRTRYLHINSAQNVLVSPNSSIGRHVAIGRVGSLGTAVGGRYNHLHIDANSSGVGAPTTNTYIDPMEFWPNAFQPATEFWPGYDTDFSSYSMGGFSALDNEECHIPSDQELVESGRYIDIELIRLIGSDKFETWLSNNPGGTVYQLIEDFKISNDQLQSKLANHIYESYAVSSPTAYKVQFSDSIAAPAEPQDDVSASEEGDASESEDDASRCEADDVSASEDGDASRSEADDVSGTEDDASESGEDTASRSEVDVSASEADDVSELETGDISRSEGAID